VAPLGINEDSLISKIFFLLVKPPWYLSGRSAYERRVSKPGYLSIETHILLGQDFLIEMYYIMYLAGLCRRRRWPEPLYESFGCPTGYTCVVRVNNREYQADGVCDTDTLARENAAMRAYLICRNFSINDGMYPTGHDHGGIVQGIPVAIGTGRRSRYADDTDTSTSGGSRSGGSSPESYDGGRVGRDRPGPVPTRALAYGHRGL